MTRLIVPAAAPAWLADYTREIERALRAAQATGFRVVATGTGVSQNITLPKRGLGVDDVLVFVSGELVASGYTINDATLTITAMILAPIVIFER